ncbi:MAG: efflux RND transporter periplasmic adaptor subunit [Saprospiraceae bacterium]|jgi:RND family efflux transporter MFP subunit
MKYLNIITFCAALFLVACGGEESADKAEGNQLKRLKAELVEKKEELKILEKEVADLQKEIEKIEPPKEDARTLVTTEKIERKDFARFIEIQGTVQSDNTYKASSEAAGRLIKFDLKEGQNVRKGQLIGTVDMESVNKQIAELQTSLDLANTTFERQKRLWEQNIGSEMQYLQAKNQKERLEKSLETIRFQLTKSKIYAPASGEVVMTYVKQGDVISPGMPLVEILNLSRVQVHAEVPETYLSSVKKGQPVTVKFPALDKETKARISLIGQQINPANRTFKVEVDMVNSGNLKPNLLAIVLLKDFEQKNAVVLPSELIQQEVSGKSYVFVEDKDEKGTVAKKVYVTISETYQGETYISEGLTGDETFIIKGARDLKDGELIEVK